MSKKEDAPTIALNLEQLHYSNKPFIRTPYNYDKDKVSKETGYSSDEPSLTVQSQKEESDINTIVRRFGLTGELPQTVNIPRYGDFQGITNYQDAMNAVIVAKGQFMELPASIRSRFNNDPQALLDFISDPQNTQEAIELGLLPKAVKTELPTQGGVSPTEGAEPKASPQAKSDKSGT